MNSSYGREQRPEMLHVVCEQPLKRPRNCIAMVMRDHRPQLIEFRPNGPTAIYPPRQVDGQVEKSRTLGNTDGAIYWLFSSKAMTFAVGIAPIFISSFRISL